LARSSAELRLDEKVSIERAGFTAFESGMSGKRLELLKEIALRAGIGQFAAIQRSPVLGSGAGHGGRPRDEQ